MTYKLVCIDVDGTLLNSRHKVSEHTKEVLLKAHRLGVHIVISTGRMYTDAEYYSKLIGVRSPVIAANGAFIKDRDSDRVIYKDTIGEGLSLELLNTFRRYSVKPYFCTPQKFYYSNLTFKLYYLLAQLLGWRSNKIDTEYVYSWERWRQILREEKDNIVKCEIIYRDPALISELKRALKGMSQLEVVESSKYNIEITKQGVSKGKAVAMLASLYKLKRNQVMAIGDSENDLSMIEYAGLGVAMANASAIVKQKANYVTGSNDDDGVADAIKKFVLREQEN